MSGRGQSRALDGDSIVRAIHEDGSITDVAITERCAVDAFNRAAVNALTASSPTAHLPARYPDERMTFTVVFCFNEVPKDPTFR